MKLLRQAPFLRVVLSFIAGILFAYYSKDSTSYPYLIGISLVFIGISFFPYLNKPYSLRHLFGMGLMGLCFSSGAYLFTQAWQTSEWEIEIKEYTYTFRILEDPIEKPKTYACKVEILSANEEIYNQVIHKKAIVYLQKDSLSKTLQSGDAIQAFVCLDKPQNFTDSFDYPNYLRKKSVAATGFVRKSCWKMENIAIPLHQQFSFLALDTRRSLLNRLQKLIPDEDSYALASAIFLGYRNDLSNDLRQRFSNTGASHTLAISGLHFSILFGMLFYFLSFCGINSHWYFLFIPFIWCFAFLTGFSPSVNRAAWMMSIWIFGHAMLIPAFSFNTLALTAFFMLLSNPLYLFDVGFQLSFMAVLSILIINPSLQNLYYSQNKLIDYTWKLITVSTSAQIGVLPLSIFYFQQFPLLFLVTNLLIVPLVSLLLFLIPVYLLLSLLFNIDGGLLNHIIHLFIDTITYLNRIPRGTITGIEINVPQVLCLYLCFIFVGIFLVKKRLIYLTLFLLSLLIYYLC